MKICISVLKYFHVITEYMITTFVYTGVQVYMYMYLTYACTVITLGSDLVFWLGVVIELKAEMAMARRYVCVEE